MTTLFVLLESGTELRSELPDESACRGMMDLWARALDRPLGSGPVTALVTLDSFDDQGHTMRVAVRSSDVRMMRYIPDDDPLLVQERAMEALRSQYDTDHPTVIDADAAEGCVCERPEYGEALLEGRVSCDDRDGVNDEKAPEEDDDDADGEAAFVWDGGEVRVG